MRVTLHHVEAVALGTKTFWFKPERPLRYEAGQFTELYLPHAHADDRGEKRWFTLSSAPTEPLLGITTKFAPVGRGSTFKQTLLGLTAGAEVTLADPMGDFVLPKDPSIPLIFVAAGIGITPVRSMVRHLQDTDGLRDLLLLYGVPTEQELAFLPLFGEYGLPFTPFVSRQYETPWTTSSHKTEGGKINVHSVLPHVLHKPGSLVYISGPETFVESLATGLQTHGVSPHRIIADFFHGY